MRLCCAPRRTRLVDGYCNFQVAAARTRGAWRSSLDVKTESFATDAEDLPSRKEEESRLVFRKMDPPQQG